MKTYVVNTAVLQIHDIWNMVGINPSGIAAISQLPLWIKLFLNKTLKFFHTKSEKKYSFLKMQDLQNVC